MGATLKRKCCCGCNEGATVTRWQNVTQGFVNSSTPSTAPYLGRASGGAEFVPWYVGPPGINFQSSQAITDTVNDIIACATPDSTHFTSDHNCYLANGTTNRKTTQRFGGKWLTAQKQWHGIFGLIDADDPNTVTAATLAAQSNVVINPALTTTIQRTAPQVKYLTTVCQAIASGTYGGSSLPAGSASSTSSVNPHSGIITTTGANSGSVTTTDTAAQTVFGILANANNAWAYGYFAAWTQSANVSGATSRILDASGIGSGPWTLQIQETNTYGGGMPWCNVEMLSVSPGSMTRTTWTPQQDSGGYWASYQLFTESISYTNTSASYSSSRNTGYMSSGGWVVNSTILRSGTINYSGPYTSADVMVDVYSLLDSWQMSDVTTFPWRMDEQLGATPLVCFDEVNAAVQPSLNYNPVMNDYSLPQIGGIWQTRAWIDPNNYVWLANGNSTNAPMNTSGGNTIETPIYTGQIISHNPAGSDSHFWFEALVWDFDNVATWTINQYGQSGSSLGIGSPISNCAMRWKSAPDSQYNTTYGAGSSIPQYPQAFIHQGGGIVTATKYVVATQKWPAVNYNLATTPIPATSLVSGSKYKIITTGSTNFTAIGSGSNSVGTIFTATGPGTGSGTAGLLVWSINLTCSSVDTSAQPAAAPSASTGVLAQWTFNQRATQGNWQSLYGVPTWYGSISGCTGISVQQFTYPAGSCRAVIGVVPFSYPAPSGGGGVLGGTTPPTGYSSEGFSNSVMFPMPDTFQFDAQFGAHWQSEIFLTMADPLCAPISPPSCSGYSWQMDNGCGYADGGTIKYYPSTPLVEASSSVPYGYSLPAGVYLPLDPAHNTLSPPCYPNGIPYPTGAGGASFTTFVTDWGFAQYVCQAPTSRFYGFYNTFVNCLKAPTPALSC